MNPCFGLNEPCLLSCLLENEIFHDCLDICFGSFLKLILEIETKVSEHSIEYVR